MFQLKINEADINYTFQHTRGTNFEVKSGKTITDVTICVLAVNDSKYEGMAACLRGDAFNKRIGRKVALQRALRQAKLSRPVRTAVWADYFKRVGL